MMTRLAALVSFFALAPFASAADPIPHRWDAGFPKFFGDDWPKKLEFSGKIQHQTVAGKLEIVGLKYNVYNSTSPIGTTLKPEQQAYPAEPANHCDGTLGAAAPVPGENFAQYAATGDSGTTKYQRGTVVKVEVLVLIRFNNNPVFDQWEVYQTSYHTAN